MIRRAAVAVSMLLVGDLARAQCPDGSPPPCASARRVQAPPPAATRARRFLLLPFRNVTRKAEQDWLTTGAPLMLGQILGQFSDLDVVPEERLTAASRKLGMSVDATDAAQLRQLAGETGGWTAISGDVFATGDSVRITARAMDLATARVLVRAEERVAAGADPREAFDRLSARLLEPAGVPPASNLAAITTRSLEAFRAYATGLDFFQRSSFRAAEDEFTRAVQLDSSFALAWLALSTASLNTGGIAAIINPMSPTYRAINQAARLATRLPRRDAQFIRGLHAIFQGDIRRGRRQLDSLLAANPDDLDVAYWVAASQFVAVSIDTIARPARLESSPQRAVTLSERILERDPRRRIAYTPPLMAYGLAAGVLWGDIFGYRRQFSSFAAAVMSQPDVREVPVLHADTLELVPRSAFDSLPQDEQRRLRQRGADAAWRWAERWLLAGPEDSEGHLWAARVAETRGDYDRALNELRVADSIGIQSAIENIAGWKLSLVVRTGRYDAAALMADSLLAAGKLTNAPFVRILDRRRGYGAAALLLARRWEAAARMVATMGSPGRDELSCASLRREMVGFSGAVLPQELRRAVMDTVTAHLAEAKTQPILAPCADALARQLDP